MYRILLVDDDQNIVDGLGSIIKQNFENIFVISSACDGSDALNRLTEDYYHVIISDIRMPKLDGISLLELISKNQIPSVVIMLSGYDDYTYIRNALRLGAYDYLLKPVESELFLIFRPKNLIIQKKIWKKKWNIFQPGFCPWTKRAQKIRSRKSFPIYPRKL